VVVDGRVVATVSYDFLLECECASYDRCRT
jgi:hypothetical protein